MITRLGYVKGGIIVFDEPAQLTEGAAVRVEILGSAHVTGTPAAHGPDALFQMDQLAVETGIPDLARNVDHYLYGHPRVGCAAARGASPL